MTTSTRDRGAVLPIVALLLPVILIMTAFAVDLGRQRSSRRTMQARADIIALDLARIADGRTLAEILDGDDTHDSAAVALADSASRNNIPLAQLDEPEWGTWTEAGGFVATTVLTSIPTAVRVTARETTDYTFRPGSGNVVRDAVATSNGLQGDPDCDPGDPACPDPTCDPGECSGVIELAGFSIGSFGARISATEAGLLNETITPILGHPVGVEAVSYQGLAIATLGVADVAAELDLVTPDEVLDTSVQVDELLLAAARVLRRSSDPNSLASASVLDSMATTPETQNLPPITLRDIVSAQQGGETAAAGATIDALSIVKVAAYLSQCTDPTDVSTCSGINVPTLSTSLPLLSSSGTLRIVQGQVAAYGPVGTSARNSQVSTTLDAHLGGQYVGTCSPSPSNSFCLVNGVVTGAVDAEVTIDATLDLANGEGTIAAIDCGDPLGLDVLTTTGLYDVTLDVTVKFGQRGVSGGLIGPTIGTLHLVGSTNLVDAGETIVFDVPPDVFNETTKEAGLGTFGLSTVTLSAPDGTGVLGTLGTLGISQTLGQVVNSFVNPMLVEYDTEVLQPLAEDLGVNVVGADVTAQRIDCVRTVFLVA